MCAGLVRWPSGRTLLWVALVKVDAQAHTCVQAMLQEGLHCWGLCGLRLDEALMCPVAGTTRLELRGRRRSGLTFHRACSTSI